MAIPQHFRKKIVFTIRLVYHWSATLLEEPQLTNHHAKRRVSRVGAQSL